MGFIKTFLKKIGYVEQKDVEDAIFKSSSWGKLFAMAKENILLSDTPNKPYKSVASVYKAIKSIADNVQQAELIFKDYTKEEEVFPPDLVKLFDKPNSEMSGTDFIQNLVGFYALYGEVFILKVKTVKQASDENAGRIQKKGYLPAELWPINPENVQKVTEKQDGRETLIGWKIGGKQYTKDELIQIKDFNPYDNWRGLKPTDPISKQIDIDFQALVYNKAFFDNDARPGYLLSTEEPLTEEQRKRLQEYFNTEHKGASKKFKVSVLEGGIKPETVGSTHQDMEFLEQLRYSREEILGTWRAPKALFNITDDLNYATFMGQMKIFWIYGIMPILKKVERTLNNQIVRPYDPNVYCQFDTRNVPAFQEDFKEKVETAQKLFAMGFTRNEINEKLELGFDEQPWGDDWWVQFSQAPASQVMNQDFSQQDTNSNEEKQVKAKETESEIIWKQFLRHHTPLETKFAGSLKRYFYEQRKRVLEKVYKSKDDIHKKDDTLIFSQPDIDWAFEEKELLKRATPYLLTGINEGIDLAKRLSGVPHGTATLEQRIAGYLARRADKIKSINDTVKNEIVSQIDQGIKNGETIENISDRIRHVYNKATNRAKTIARTETTGTLNGGSVLYYEDIGLNSKKWVTAGDEQVRDLHQMVGGEVVRMNQRFSNGLDFPGGDGAPEEVINCRCTVVGVATKDEA